MKSFPLPSTEPMLMVNVSVLGAKLRMSLMLLAPRSFIICSVKIVRAEPMSRRSVLRRVPLSVWVAWYPSSLPAETSKGVRIRVSSVVVGTDFAAAVVGMGAVWAGREARQSSARAKSVARSGE